MLRDYTEELQYVLFCFYLGMTYVLFCVAGVKRLYKLLAILVPTPFLWILFRMIWFSSYEFLSRKGELPFKQQHVWGCSRAADESNNYCKPVMEMWRI